MNTGKRLLSALLCACMIAALLPTAALAAGTDTGKAIQLVDSGTAANISGGQDSNIYFGRYKQSSNDSDGYNTDPIKWRVLENAKGQLFLLSDQNLDVFQYHTKQESVTWETSTMRSWLNGYDASHNTGGNDGIDYTDDNFISTAFSDGEQGAIAETEVVNDDNSKYHTEGGNDTTDKIFLLSIAEAQNSSYFADNDSRVATNTAYAAGGGASGGVGGAGFWWLRSPGGDQIYGAADVLMNGSVAEDGGYVNNTFVAVRPAFHLDLTSVLFTSAAVGGKIPAAESSDNQSGEAADAIFEIDGYGGNEWKLTLLDGSRDFSISKAKIEESKIDFSYSGAQTGTNEYISVVIEDNGAITYYGRILQLDGMTNGAEGTTNLTLPAGVTLDNDTKLYVFNEQYNGGENDDTRLTDYGSKMIDVQSAVDTTAPKLTSGSATRDSETDATVKFTSSEAGEYYYAIVESGASEPEITTTGTGTACTAEENTISLTKLTGNGAKDIYIVVKDEAGNVSKKQKVTIPEYIPPVYEISASPATLDFGSQTVGYTEAPAAQTVTIKNEGNQNTTVSLPTSTNYTITAGKGFTGSAATLAPDGTAQFTVQPITGLDVENYAETLTVSGTENVSAQVALSFAVVEPQPATYSLTVNLNGGNGVDASGEYAENAVVEINAGSRSNYRFDGWTSSNGGTFADTSSAATTFTMPAASTTITANWRYIGGGGGGGGSEGTSRPTYRPDVENTENGDVSVQPSNPHKGDEVTVTPRPEDGYEVEAVIVTDKDGKPVDVTDNGDGTWTFTQPGGKATVEVIFREIPLGTLPFTDVPESAWYCDAVRYVYENGLMNGIGGGAFNPNGTTTRGQIMTILWRMAGSPGMEGEIWGYPFADVDATAYYGTAVYWARMNGIAEGYGDGKFGPDDPITREQFAAILYRFAQELVYDVTAAADLSGYADAGSISGYALAAIQWANAEGIISGTSDTTLTPQGQTTRAQAAAMLMRFCEQ
ncbi:S-layer homology domain-containing protein [Agathobaculum sp. NSJ-28]|uniref:S-layer homology domain-containing protein n=1 Tax=Agathobaculum faecis TaxID=2763013 RepID=A0A923LZA4_9FIRM|nr:S-layer homology domain-containing protein [Agathobaculum faecis]MBC5726694.1 S-layer homology domain-containing protein [Agathobaculum faecis]MBS6884262.1 S-layer homology domain-containing protein [Clostridiaceae bacterium]